MSYSFSFDASLKLRGSDIRGFLNHYMRENDEVKQKQHSNENINTALSKNNMTLFYNADTGKMQPAVNSEQIMEAINKRLSKALDLKNNTYLQTGKKVRCDAVQCRGLIMQLDPEFYKDNRGNSEAMLKSFSDMLHLVQRQYGKESIVSISCHLDECSPHLHALLVPVTNDGRLSQKDFIDKKKLIVAHKEMREELRSKGYDIDLERRTPKGAKRLSEKDYKDLKDSEKKLQALNNLEISLKQRKRQQDDKETQLDIEKDVFERFRASESQRLENSRQLEQQAIDKLHEAEELYNESKELHSKLMNMSDVFVEQYADDYAKELGYTKKSISKGLSM